MQKTGVAKFKEQCLSLPGKVDKNGIITKHGNPVAKLVSIEVQSSELMGKLKGKIKIKGDIMSTGLKWHAQP